MGYQEDLDAFKNAIAADLPARLTTAGLANFEEYLADTPRNPDKRQLGVFQGVPSETPDRRENEIIIHATLIGIERPTDYLTQIIASFKSIRPKLIGMQILESWEALPMYAGTEPEGGGGSYIQFSLVFSKELDDCE